MINYDNVLPCGARLQIVDIGDNAMTLIRLTAPENQTLSNVAQIKDNRITVAIDPASLKAIRPLLRGLLGREGFWQRIKNLLEIE